MAKSDKNRYFKCKLSLYMQFIGKSDTNHYFKCNTMELNTSDTIFGKTGQKLLL